MTEPVPYCDWCGTNATAPTEGCADCPGALFHLPCLVEHQVGRAPPAEPAPKPRRQKNAVLPDRDSRFARARKKADIAGELREAGVHTARVGFDSGHRFVVGHGSRFHSPIYGVASAVSEALDPKAPPPRRFVPKRRKDHTHEGPLVSADLRVLTQRYRGWAVADVAKANPKFLLWLLGIEGGQIAPEVRREVRRLVFAHWSEGSKARR